jgi:hypothetical protein
MHSDAAEQARRREAGCMKTGGRKVNLGGGERMAPAAEASPLRELA